MSEIKKIFCKFIGKGRGCINIDLIIYFNYVQLIHKKIQFCQFVYFFGNL